MSKQTIGIGASANDGTGDSARVGGDKINDNFTELYAKLTYYETSGTDTYTVTIPNMTVQIPDTIFLIRVMNVNTTTCTLNVNGLGAAPILRNGQQLAPEFFIAGGIYLMAYNGSGWLIIGNDNLFASTALNLRGNNTVIEEVTATTNSFFFPLTIKGSSTGTPALGIGTSLGWMVETAVGNNEQIARIDAVTTDVTGGSEDADLVFKVMAAGAAASEKLRLTSTGNLCGLALHDNSVSPTGATNHYIASGTYTPTLTNTTNITASTSYSGQWMRVGNVVNVSGMVDVDPTGAGSTVLGISLPLASNIGNIHDCGGVAFSPAIAGQGAAILGDVANDRATMQWIAVDVTNQTMHYTFTYEIKA